MHNDGETDVGIAVDDDQEVVVDQEALVADDDEEVVVAPLLQVVVAEVVVGATPFVDDVLKDLVRADVDPVVVDDDVNELFVVDELFVVAFSDADSDVSHVDFVVNSLSLTLVDEFPVVDADLLVSHLVDVVIAYLKTFVVKLLDVELYLYVALISLVVVNLFVVNLYLYVVD